MIKAPRPSWEQAITKICNINSSTKDMMYNLNGITSIYKYLNDPMKNIKFIHAAGTNGKGTFCTKVARSINLAYPNLKVGLFTSPHISTLRERIQIN
jgi:dihydrofolate synthase / folylpolyglutamate synthase